MNSSTISQNSSVNPGYGYRLLQPGEIIGNDDESKVPHGPWELRRQSLGGIGKPYQPEDGHHYPTRRPIDVGAGYRLVGEHERIERTDQWTNEERRSLGMYFSLWSSGTTGGSVGLTPAQALRDGEVPVVTTFRRSEEQPKSEPAAVSPGFGYRILQDSETIKEGDEYTDQGNRWCRCCVTIGSTVADAKEQWSDIGYPSIRRALVAPQGFRFLAAEEIVSEGDVYFDSSEAFRTDDEVWSQLGETAKNAVANMAHVGVDGILRKVETNEQKLERELKAERDAHAKTKVQLANTEAKLNSTEKVLATTEDELDSAEEKLVELRADMATMKKNASGNAVLVRNNGFSKPIMAPARFSYTSGKYELPSTIRCAEYAGTFEVIQPYQTHFLGHVGVRTVTFVQQAGKDGFGRTIYRQA